MENQYNTSNQAGNAYESTQKSTGSYLTAAAVGLGLAAMTSGCSLFGYAPVGGNNMHNCTSSIEENIEENSGLADTVKEASTINFNDAKSNLETSAYKPKE